MKKFSRKRLIWLLLVVLCVSQNFFGFLPSDEIEKVKADESDAIYLMMAEREGPFGGWGGGAEDQTLPHTGTNYQKRYTEEPNGKYGLYLLGSGLEGSSGTSGVNFDYLNEHPVISQEPPTNNLTNDNPMTRDAAIVWYYGKFWVMWPHSPQENSNAATPHGHFDLFYSDPLAGDSLDDWHQWLDGDGNPSTPFNITGSHDTGGGSWYVDENGLPHALMASSITGLGSAKIYESHPTVQIDAEDPYSWDLTEGWSTPQPLLTTGEAQIGSYDPTMIHVYNSAAGYYYHYLFVSGGVSKFYRSTVDPDEDGENGGIINDWTVYAGESGNTSVLATIDEGLSATPIAYDADSRVSKWRVYGDTESSAARFVGTAFTDLTTTSSGSFASSALTDTVIDVDPFGPNVIRLDPDNPSDLPAIEAVQNFYDANHQSDPKPEWNLSYSATTVEGVTKPLNSDFNYPIRTYNLTAPEGNATWNLDFQLPLTAADTPVVTKPASASSVRHVTDSGSTSYVVDGGWGINSYRIYSYRDIYGARYYSTEYASTEVELPGTTGAYYVTVSWPAATNASGYLLLVDNPMYSGWPLCLDVGSVTSYDDNGSGQHSVDDLGWQETGNFNFGAYNIIPTIPDGWKWKVTANLPSTGYTVALNIRTTDKYLHPANTHIYNVTSTAHTVYFEMTWDADSNSYTFVDDTTSPTTSRTIAPSSTPNGLSDYYTTPPTINLNASDNAGGGGIDHLNYCWGTGCTDWTSVDGSSVGLTVPDEGTNLLRYYSVDIAGNSEVSDIKELEIKVDSIKPTLLVMNQSVNRVNAYLDVTGVASDDSSGTSSVTVNGNPVTLPESGIFTYRLQNLTLGNNVISVVAIDLAGNTETSSFTVNYSPLALTSDNDSSPSAAVIPTSLISASTSAASETADSPATVEETAVATPESPDDTSVTLPQSNATSSVNKNDSSSTDSDINWPIVGGAAIIIVAVLGITIAIRRRGRI